jgi:hypothetical protein
MEVINIYHDDRSEHKHTVDELLGLRLSSSGTWHRVVWYKNINGSKEPTASIFMVKKGLIKFYSVDTSGTCIYHRAFKIAKYTL